MKNIFEHIKTYTKIHRQNRNAYLLKFSLSHNFNIGKTKVVYNNSISKSDVRLTEQSWFIWVPKSECERITDSYFIIDEKLFNSINTTNVCGTEFNKIKNEFIISSFPSDILIHYQSVIRRNSNLNTVDYCGLSRNNNPIDDQYGYGYAFI